MDEYEYERPIRSSRFDHVPPPTTAAPLLPLPPSPGNGNVNLREAPITLPVPPPPPAPPCAPRESHPPAPPPPPPPPADSVEYDDDDDDDNMALMAAMGLPTDFDTSNGKKVADGDVSCARVVKKRKFRQYMNRSGGFNRPLDPS